MTALLLNHLWQSTLFAAAAALLTLVFRKNRAAIRYGLWFAASMKFLIPFSLLTGLGAVLFHPVVPVPPQFYDMQPAVQPFSAGVPLLAAPAAGPDWTLVAAGLWAIGLAAILALWLTRWSRLRSVLQGAKAVPSDGPIPVKLSPASLEPGLVGIWRPVLLLPEGIVERLTPAEMRAIMAHELCHLRRRDNLAATLHMMVEALFWFHPLVWWLGARLIAERENACDENVIESGNDPKTYAEGILKVCKLYVHSPLACAAGISGADLKMRIETIMASGLAVRLNILKTAILAAAAVLAVAAPLALGLVASPLSLVQAVAQSASADDLFARRRAEQAMPRKVIPLDPRLFDKFVGYYQLMPASVLTVRREGTHFYSDPTGGVEMEFFPESPTKFFANALLEQISFDTDAQGNVTQLILHEAGMELPARRIDAAAAKAIEDALAQRIKANKPSPGTEQALRHQIEAIERGGVADFSAMSNALAAIARPQAPLVAEEFKQWGPLKSLAFKAVGQNGIDIYYVAFEHQDTEWRIGQPGADGKIAALKFRPLP